ncbi:hypothetical protein UBN10_03070 [Helicobacter pylori]
MLILTCGVAQTNDLFVPNKKQKTSVKEKIQIHYPLYKNNLKRNLKNTNKPHTSKKNITL